MHSIRDININIKLVLSLAILFLIPISVNASDQYNVCLGNDGYYSVMADKTSLTEEYWNELYYDGNDDSASLKAKIDEAERCYTEFATKIHSLTINDINNGYVSLSCGNLEIFPVKTADTCYTTGTTTVTCPSGSISYSNLTGSYLDKYGRAGDGVNITFNQSNGTYNVSIKDIYGSSTYMRYVSSGMQENDGSLNMSSFSGQMATSVNGYYNFYNIPELTSIVLEFYQKSSDACDGHFIGRISFTTPSLSTATVTNPLANNPSAYNCDTVKSYVPAGMTNQDDLDKFNSLKKNYISECYSTKKISYNKSLTLGDTINTKFNNLKRMFANYHGASATTSNTCTDTYKESKISYEETGTYWSIVCTEDYEATGDSAKLVAAGSGFNYLSNFKVKRTCTLTKMDLPSSYGGDAGEGISCVESASHSCSWTGNGGGGGEHGGPTEDFDACVKTCDGGKYTQNCINTCYTDVYGIKRNISFLDNMQKGIKNNNIIFIKQCDDPSESCDSEEAEEFYNNEGCGGGGCYSHPEDDDDDDDITKKWDSEDWAYYYEQRNLGNDLLANNTYDNGGVLEYSGSGVQAYFTSKNMQHGPRVWSGEYYSGSGNPKMGHWYEITGSNGQVLDRFFMSEWCEGSGGGECSGSITVSCDGDGGGGYDGPTWDEDAANSEKEAMLAEANKTINMGNYTVTITDSYLKSGNSNYEFVVNTDSASTETKEIKVGDITYNVTETTDSLAHATKYETNTTTIEGESMSETVEKEATIYVELPLSYVNRMTGNVFYRSNTSSNTAYLINASKSKLDTINNFNIVDYYHQTAQVTNPITSQTTMQGERKYYTDLRSDNINVSFDANGKASLIRYGDYNIKINSDKVGTAEFSSQINCYYGVYNNFLNPDGSANNCNPETEICDSGIKYIFRPIDLGNVFPGNGSETFDKNGRSPRFNWTGTVGNTSFTRVDGSTYYKGTNAALGSGQNLNIYKDEDVNPEALTKIIQNKGENIYNESSGEIEYEFILTGENIKNIKNYNKNVSDINGDGYKNYLDYNMSCYNKNGKVVCTSKFLDNESNNYVTYGSGYSIEQRKSIAGCNNAIDNGTECDTSINRYRGGN